MLVIIMGSSIALGIYYRLPDNTNRVASSAMLDGSPTKLGRANKALLAANSGQAGIHLLPDGRDAFVARAVLAREAQQTIDVQYYMYHQDTVGSLLTQELLAAADRGVRVRMLIDDIYGAESEDTWVTLNAHPNMEVRLWNPWRRHRNRTLQSILRFRDINFRMHSKSFTVDGEFTILGGRNIGDEYFNANPEVAFSDIDVVAIGPPVEEVSRVFDDYWNHAFSYPVERLIRVGSTEAVAALRDSRDSLYSRPATKRYVEALVESDLAQELASGSLNFSWSEARVIYDSPSKKDQGPEDSSKLLISQLAPYIVGSSQRVFIVSPYFVPGDRAADALIELAAKGVDVRVLTNSLASNDVTAVHAGYAKYRRKLLRGGVRLFEFDESLKDRAGKLFTWLPGLSKSSLHAKTMVMDGEWMFVGSFNFDQRSLHINNEIGLLFKNPELAGRSSRDFANRVGEVAFEVRFSRPDGTQNMQWVGGVGGADVVMEQEPYATSLQKGLVGILKWLPIDSQL